jgi:PmbA protein
MATSRLQGTATVSADLTNSNNSNNSNNSINPTHSPLKNELDRLSHATSLALKFAREKGATDCAVSASVSRGLGVDVRLGEVETVAHYLDHEFGIMVYQGKQSASVSTSDLSEKAIAEAVEKAVSIAKFTEADACAGLAEPQDLAKTWPELKLYYPWDVSIEKATELAQELEALAMESDPRINNSEGANVTASETAFWYAASNGFSAGELSSRHSLSVSVLAEENGLMQRDSDYTLARCATDFENLSLVAKRAGQGAAQRLGARKLATGKYPVILRSDIATGLIGSLLSGISGSNLYRKQSFLVDQAGKKLFPDFMEILEDPFIHKGLSSTPYDAEGVSVRPRKLVDQGVLQGYLLSTYSARRLGLKSTGNSGGAHNILVKNTGESLDQLLKQMGTGILITELFGQGVNLMNGDYSRGAFGFWVENGEIQYPVEEFTIAGNLSDMFQSIAGIGTDTETRSKIQVGSILLAEMMVAGE